MTTTFTYAPTIVTRYGVFSLPLPILGWTETPHAEVKTEKIPTRPGMLPISSDVDYTEISMRGLILGYPINGGVRDYTGTKTIKNVQDMKRIFQGYYDAGGGFVPGVVGQLCAVWRFSDAFYVNCFVESMAFEESNRKGVVVPYSMSIKAYCPFPILQLATSVSTAQPNGTTAGPGGFDMSAVPSPPWNTASPWATGAASVDPTGAGGGNPLPMSPAISSYQMNFSFKGRIEASDVNSQIVLYPQGAGSMHVTGIGIASSSAIVSGASGTSTVTVSLASLNSTAGQCLSVSATQAQRYKVPTTASPGLAFSLGDPIFIHVDAAAGGHVDVEGYIFVQMG
jgi:hypothetical protein